MTYVSRQFLLPVLIAAGLSLTAGFHAAEPPRESVAQSRPGLPVDFIENRGQWGTRARFVARHGQVSAALEPQAIRLQLGRTPVGLVFEGANPSVVLQGEDERPTVYNFFAGKDPAAWRTGLPAYRSVLYRGMYDGIDVRMRDSGAHFEYDLILAPGRHPERVVIRTDGAARLELAANGDLVIHTAAGAMRQTPPHSVEILPGGGTRAIASRFRLIDETRYGFEVPERDEALPLVIDPGIVWSTLTGGTTNEQMSAMELARDGSGDIFLAGNTASPDFGTTPSPVQTARHKAYVARLDASGSHYEFVTFVNGLQNQTYAGGLGADTAGGVTFVGTTVDLDFPTTPGVFQPQFGSPNGNGQSVGDGFVMRLNASGGLVFSTYLGGVNADAADHVVVDPSGNLIITGYTKSPAFPTTAGAYDTVFNAPPAGDPTAVGEDAFIVRMSPDGSAISYSTFYGGQTYERVFDIALDPNGFLTMVGATTSSETGRNIPVTADAFDSTWNGWEDGFIARFKLDGSGASDLRYSSFLGGVNLDAINGVAFNPADPELVTVVGMSWYDNFTGPFFPTTAGAFKPALTPDPPATQLFPHSKTGFVTQFRFPASGAATLRWSTFAGGNWEDFLSDVAIDETGAVIVAGGTRSYDLITTRGAIDRTQDGPGSGPDDCFVWKLSPAGDQLLYSTYFGGTSGECQDVLTIGGKIAYLGNSTIVLAATTTSGDFETTPGAVSRTADEFNGASNSFVAKLQIAADASGDLTVDAPTLLNPPNNSATGGSGGAVRFEWSAVADPSGIEGYVYEIAGDPSFPSGFTHYKGSTNSPELILDTIAFVPWYWRVRAADRAGNLSEWSQVSTFRTGVTGAPPIINAINVYPTTLTGGSSALGFLYLTDPAPPGGYVARLVAKDGRSVLQTQVAVGVPETVTIPAGALTVSFPVTSVPVTAATPAAIYATVNGIGAKWSGSVVPTTGPVVSSLTLEPFMVTGGNPASGTITLTEPAGPGGTVVPLQTSHPDYATIPASVTVPAGARSATFPITTRPVAFSFDVMIEATGGGFAAKKLALRTPGVRMTSFTLSASTATGGTNLTGTIRFSGPVPFSPFPATGSALVAVKTTHPAVGLSPLVEVPEGQSSVTFNMSVQNVPATTALELIASYDDTVLRVPMTITGSSAALASMTVNVNTVTGGQGGVGFVNLTAAAPAGHVLVTLSANHPAISLPPNVMVSAGSTSGIFSWGALPVETTTPVTITASYGASTASVNVTVNPRVDVYVTSLTLNPTSVAGGSTAIGTVSLNAAAPSGGISVQLSSQSPASAPPSVTVPAGATSATFNVTTSAVSSTAVGKVWALLNTSWAAALTVTPGAGGGGAALSALSINPATVSGGTSSTGTVTLTGPAPSGGTVVGLSSSNTSAATVPSSVTVPAGSSSRTFTATTAPVTSTTPVTLTATLGTASRTAGLTVTAAGGGGGGAPGFVSPGANSPDSGGDGNGFQTSAVNAHGDDAAVATDTNSGSGTSTSCTSTAKDRHRFFDFAFAIPAGSAIAGLEVRLDARADSTSGAPRMCVQLSSDGGTTWTAAKATGTLGTSLTTFTLGGAADTWGRSWSPADLASANFRLRVINVASSTSRDFFLDWVAARPHTAASGPAALSAVSLSPTSVRGGTPSTGTVTLTADAPSGGAVVALASSNVAVAQVPTSVTVSSGATSATFPVSTSTVGTNTGVTITGTYEAASRTATLTVTPEPPPTTLSALGVSPASVTGGSGATGTATLTSAAPAGGAVVTLTSSNTAAATVAASFTVPAGATSATFGITTSAVSSSTTVTFTATYGGVSRTAALTVNAPAPSSSATLTVTATGRSGERITSSPSGISVSVGSSGSAAFSTGTSITLTVSDGRDAIFSGACSSGGNKQRSCTFTLNANASVTANVQ